MDRAEVLRLLAARAAALRIAPEVLDRAAERCRAVPQAAAARPGPELTVLESTAPAPAAAHLPIGAFLGGYRILGLLGAGGMGQVYEAEQLSMHRTVALKVLAPRGGVHATARDRFIREARAAGHLHHPNLIAVHDVGEDEGRVFYSMELVRGRSLRGEIARRGTLPVGEALDYIAQALRGLRYAHDQGVIHRDIKPDNLMLQPGADEWSAHGRVRIADLGLSRWSAAATAGDDPCTTQDGVMLGTPHYMAPEQAQDAHTADARADIYGIGATLYHLVCGRPPFTGATPIAVVVAAGSQELVFPDPPPPPAICALIRRLMARDPAQRPADAMAALHAVDAALGSTTGKAAHPPAHTRVPGVRRRWPWILVGVAALVAAVLWLPVLVAQQAWRHERDRIRAVEATGAHADALAEARLALARQERLAAAIAEEPLAQITGAARWARRRVMDGHDLVHDLAARWDLVARHLAQGRLTGADDDNAAGRHLDALEQLAAIPAEQRSPAVSAAIAQRERAALDGQEAVVEALRTQGEAEARLTDERRRGTIIAGIIAAQALPQRATPATALTRSDGGVRCTGTGSAERDAPGFWDRPGRGQASLRYRVRIGAGAWRLVLNDSSTLVWTPEGVDLHRPNTVALRLAVPDAEGWITTSLAAHDGRIAVASPGGATPIPGKRPERLIFRWDIPDGQAADVGVTLAVERPRPSR
jgi:hypothetical protein